MFLKNVEYVKSISICFEQNWIFDILFTWYIEHRFTLKMFLIYPNWLQNKRDERGANRK